MSRFKVGQQVVCIDGNWEYKGQPEFGPKEGDIVTVFNYYNDEYIRIVEFRYLPTDGSEASYSDTQFAPLMDISELKEILEVQEIEI